jgi:hypothetical protein
MATSREGIESKVIKDAFICLDENHRKRHVHFYDKNDRISAF